MDSINCALLAEIIAIFSLSAEDINITKSGIENFLDGFQIYGSNPQDSLVVGNKLTVLFDGIKFITHLLIRKFQFRVILLPGYSVMTKFISLQYWQPIPVRSNYKL